MEIGERQMTTTAHKNIYLFAGTAPTHTARKWGILDINSVRRSFMNFTPKVTMAFHSLTYREQGKASSLHLAYLALPSSDEL